MARPLRLEHRGALWHVTSRGNNREMIFHDDDDRESFLGILAGVVALFNWRIHAWVLMSTHGVMGATLSFSPRG
ncbi:MAG: transposase [Acidobacteria bacterium]|nr:transposase [Acidobacteriota bacterium]